MRKILCIFRCQIAFFAPPGQKQATNRGTIFFDKSSWFTCCNQKGIALQVFFNVKMFLQDKEETKIFSIRVDKILLRRYYSLNLKDQIAEAQCTDLTTCIQIRYFLLQLLQHFIVRLLFLWHLHFETFVVTKSPLLSSCVTFFNKHVT